MNSNVVGPNQIIKVGPMQVDKLSLEGFRVKTQKFVHRFAPVCSLPYSASPSCLQCLVSPLSLSRAATLWFRSNSRKNDLPSIADPRTGLSQTPVPVHVWH